MVDYLTASIGPKGSTRRVEFDWQSADHDGGRRVAAVNYVGRDEIGHQDIGLSPLRDSIRGMVFGVDWLDKLESLEEELRTPGLKTLTHPMKGLIDCRVIRWRWTQRSMVQERADISIEFVRAGDEIPAVFDVPTISAKQIQAAREAIEADASDRWNLLNQVDNFAKASLQKLRDANDALLTTKGKINARFAVVDQLAFAIQDLDDSLTSLLNAPSEIAGKFANLALQVFDLVTTATTTERQSAPKLIVDAVRDMAEFGNGDDERILTTPLRIEHDTTMRAINDDVRALGLIAAAKSLTDVDYDSSATAAEVREDMSELFDGALESSDLSSAAHEAMTDVFTSLSRFLTDRIQNLPAITTYTPPETTNALLVAHEIYGDATRAEEIIIRNNIRCPNMVPGGQALEVLSV